MGEEIREFIITLHEVNVYSLDVYGDFTRTIKCKPSDFKEEVKKMKLKLFEKNVDQKHRFLRLHHYIVL